ncbi:iron complex outermembrane receptor protein [Dyadobacter jejuensis]|uniref:Iron complex outermembrane receptor protein n=1 Tax=Dyadobacter jejuensis TaxID=1082580 RepID=A0A316AGT1_9BACT|nr:TonB-dependent receptor [Dyadobacter jejuensis]PWJ56841.1 iron complex outermembrane receptor protein [Dyadobacter jejuensis]
MNRVFYLIILLGLSLQAISQKLKVQGEVVGPDGLPLAGVSVKEKGLASGAITDAQGKYSFYVVDVNGSLQASAPGYTLQEEPINAQSTHHFRLQKTPILHPRVLLGSRSFQHADADTLLGSRSISVKEVLPLLGVADVNHLLSYMEASFNARQQLSADGTFQLAPGSIRGLGADQMLVLVNGKRRHQSAVMSLLGTIGRGQTSTDLNAIPLAAIDRVEILTEGAVAQYGSDAVGGVINLILKESSQELLVHASSGVNRASHSLGQQSFDGLHTAANLNYGFGLPQKGFINVTGDFNLAQATNRAQTANKNSDMIRQQFGNPQVGSGALFLNGRMPLKNESELYVFGGLSRRNWLNLAHTRFPGDPRNIDQVYPEGYNPQVKSLSDDGSMAIGLKTVRKGWDIDLSTSVGFNQNRYSLTESLNPSQGPLSQHEFKAGGFQRAESMTNIDFSRYFGHMLQGVNVAFGAEYRYETYKIVTGERPAYYNYLFELATGAQGFPGFGPDNATENSRMNADGYVDVEANFSPNLRFDASVRYAYYQNQGSAIAGKLGLRYIMGPTLSAKVSVESGFRAPSLPQQHFSSIYSVYQKGVPQDVLVVPVGHPIAKSLGLQDLKMEQSQQARIGLLFQPDQQFTLGVDAYYVQVKKRIGLSSLIMDPTVAPELDALHANQLQFLSNALTSTTTSGIDANLGYRFFLGEGSLDARLQANFNWMDLGANSPSPLLDGKSNPYFGLRERYLLMAAAPNSKINLSVNYKQDRFNALLRLVRYGQHQLYNWNEELVTYSPKLGLDASFQYLLQQNISVTLGGENLLNVFPDATSPTLTETGGSWEALQTGIAGTYLFLKVGLAF